MRITQREKTLLTILGIVAIVALSYIFLFSPQLDRIAELKVENDEYKQRVESIHNEIANVNELVEKKKELETALGEKTKPFFPSIMQDKILLILDDAIKKAQTTSPSSSFGQIAVVEIEEMPLMENESFPPQDIADKYRSYYDEEGQGAAGNTVDTTQQAGNSVQNPEEKPIQAQNMSAMLQVNGSYPQIMSFIKEIEALNRTVVVSDISMAANEAGAIEGNIKLDFYALPKIQDQDQEYMNWTLNGIYGKPNPFAR